MTREATLQSAETNKLLMRRYAMVQKARDADVFGILVGTLGVGSPLFYLISGYLDNQRVSIISFSYRPSSSSLSTRSQEGVHDQRGKAQPCEARQLCRDRMLRSRRMPRKLTCRCKGTIDA